MIARIVTLVVVVALAAAQEALAQHRVEVTDLVVTQAGRPVADVAAGSRVAIECRYRVTLDRGFPRRRALPEWSGELSAADRPVRVFEGELRAGQHVARAEWVAESSGPATILCRLDRAGALRGVEGTRTRQARLRVVAEAGSLVECPASLTASISASATATAGRGRAGQGSIALTLMRSQPDGNVAACYYASRNQDVRDFRVELACRQARRARSTSTPRTQAAAGAADLHRYLCGAP
jgi:hypothetical protein